MKTVDENREYHFRYICLRTRRFEEKLARLTPSKGRSSSYTGFPIPSETLTAPPLGGTLQ